MPPRWGWEKGNNGTGSYKHAIPTGLLQPGGCGFAHRQLKGLKPYFNGREVEPRNLSTTVRLPRRARPTWLSPTLADRIQQLPHRQFHHARAGVRGPVIDQHRVAARDDAGREDHVGVEMLFASLPRVARPPSAVALLRRTGRLATLGFGTKSFQDFHLLRDTFYPRAAGAQDAQAEAAGVVEGLDAGGDFEHGIAHGGQAVAAVGGRE